MDRGAVSLEINMLNRKRGIGSGFSSNSQKDKTELSGLRDRTKKRGGLGSSRLDAYEPIERKKIIDFSPPADPSDDPGSGSHIYVTGLPGGSGPERQITPVNVEMPVLPDLTAGTNWRLNTLSPIGSLSGPMLTLPMLDQIRLDNMLFNNTRGYRGDRGPSQHPDVDQGVAEHLAAYNAMLRDRLLNPPKTDPIIKGGPTDFSGFTLKGYEQPFPWYLEDALSSETSLWHADAETRKELNDLRAAFRAIFGTDADETLYQLLRTLKDEGVPLVEAIVLLMQMLARITEVLEFHGIDLKKWGQSGLKKLLSPILFIFKLLRDGDFEAGVVLEVLPLFLGDLIMELTTNPNTNPFDNEEQFEEIWNTKVLDWLAKKYNETADDIWEWIYWNFLHEFTISYPR